MEKKPLLRLSVRGEDKAYCAFRNDRFRLWALVSRDIRLVIIAVLVALGIGTSHFPWSLLVR